MKGVRSFLVDGYFCVKLDNTVIGHIEGGQRDWYVFVKSKNWVFHIPTKRRFISKEKAVAAVVEAWQAQQNGG